MISIIVAVADNYAIGKQGDLLCHMPSDLKHFKAITSGHPVIMGERTYYSLPKRPLPNRRNIVLTDVVGKQIEGAEVVYSIPEAIAAVKNMESESGEPVEAFILGGGMVYRQFMTIADKLYITHIHHSWPDADTFFPEIEPTIWKAVAEEHHEADDNNPYPYSFVEYVRA